MFHSLHTHENFSLFILFLRGHTMGATNIRLISMRIGLDYAKEPKSNIKNAKLITITKNTLTSNYQSQTHEIVGNKKGKKRGGGELKIRYL